MQQCKAQFLLMGHQRSEDTTDFFDTFLKKKIITEGLHCGARVKTELNALALKPLKLRLRIVLRCVLNRVLCVKGGICWSRGSYDALFCTQEGGIIAAVVVATENTQATASIAFIYCMCTDISMPTSGTCNSKKIISFIIFLIAIPCIFTGCVKRFLFAFFVFF